MKSFKYSEVTDAAVPFAPFPPIKRPSFSQAEQIWSI